MKTPLYNCITENQAAATVSGGRPPGGPHAPGSAALDPGAPRPTLWPGQLGTHVPESESITFGELDEVIQPALELRRTRWHRVRWALSRYRSEVKALAFSQDWEFRRDPDEIGLEQTWHSTVPGED